MPILEVTDAQIIELVKQLPAERKRAVLLALAKESDREREERLEYAQTQVRRLSAERGLDWDAMSEEDRETFIDELVHEDRRRVSIHL